VEGSYDIVIVGGGPAGMAAALWAADLNLRSVLIERASGLGGQLSNVFNPIKNYPGRAAKNGDEMRFYFLETLEGAEYELALGQEVISADLDSRSIGLEDGTTISGRILVIATGVRRRELNVPGEAELKGKGILNSGAKEPSLVRDANVIVVGGGDAAVENALILSEYANQVTVIHRNDRFKARSEFLEAARSKQNIQFLTNKTIEQFVGDDRLETVDITDQITRSKDSLSIDFALVRVGFGPNSDLFESRIETDADGYILVSEYCETNVPNVYAIGDVANPRAQNISSACGDAAKAISHISKSLNTRD
jgi:thioredoxin reductase (NADPH)